LALFLSSFIDLLGIPDLEGTPGQEGTPYLELPEGLEAMPPPLFILDHLGWYTLLPAGAFDIFN